MTMDLFEKVAGAKANRGGVYPVAGVYPIVQVNACKLITGRSGDRFFCAELDILESNVKERPAGSTMSWLPNFRHESAPANVKTFLAVVNGIPETEVDPEGVAFAVSEKNPCHGRLVRLEASTIITKNKGLEFTLCKWVPLPPEVQAKAAELRAKAGF